ncbi:hypothetical protein [Myxococcus landrumensis]|uniref:Secreted protein n=1 Tax=Myxococcus landrumensis TaxID=2813577 RepID=A0ABX7N2K1_9BACT|nr:hypothetical protein [Myxococcus landrumus]QSQ12950.1 hypothetical protein JY572_32075 [Myxococcus landrumus]
MQPLLRILAIFLVLMTGGVFQTLAFASQETEPCADAEEAGQPCEDCASDCVLCLCCPLRAATPSLPEVDVSLPTPRHEPAPSRPPALALSGVSSDIFQPPKT